MKSLVLYDSQFGNTEKIARAIGAALGETHEATVAHMSDASPADTAGLDLLVVGSPTQRFRPTPATSEFLKSLPPGALDGVRTAAFDTRLTAEEIEAVGVLAFFVRIFGYAAAPIDKALQKHGGQPACAATGFYVQGMEGPLLGGELERAAAWARSLASQR